MINVFVDASLSKKRWGCAGVVIQPCIPISFSEVSFRYPLRSGLKSNQGEMLAIIHSAHACRQVLKLIEYDPLNTFVTIRTDSVSCAKALTYPSRLRSKPFIALAKTARMAWDRLREDDCIAGWGCSHITRKNNPADRVSKIGRAYYLELYKWEIPNSPKTSGRSSFKGSAQKDQQHS